jgi:putative ABC transport system permease protein
LIAYMIVQNVLHRPLRTLITVIGVAVEVTLVIIVVGLTTGLITESAKRTQGVGADIMIQPPAASILMAFSGAPMPIRIADKLRGLEYVQSVTPVLALLNSMNGLEVVYGIDPDSFREVSRGFVFHDGHDLENPDDILVDDIYARGKHVKVGQTLHVLGHDFHVAGIVEHGKGARLFVLLTTLQEMMGASDKASVFYVKCDRSDHTPAVADEIQGLLPGYEVRQLKDMFELMTSSGLPGLNAFISVMIGIAVTIGFLVIFLSLYTTVLERTREIGVLKALGASRSYIIGTILSETTLLCLGGIAVGVGLSFALKTVFMRIFPTMTILMLPKWIAISALIAIFGGFLGASYPAWMASRKDAVEALSYE